MNLFTPKTDYATDWEKVLALNPDTVKGRVLRDLLNVTGGYIRGWGGWYGNWWTRLTELRALGVPIADRKSGTHPNEKEYAIVDDLWREEYFDRKLGRRR